jgi:fatty-acyl-CoA synthase
MTCCTECAELQLSVLTMGWSNKKGSLLGLLNRHRFRDDPFCNFWRGNSETTISFAQLFVEASRFRRVFIDSAIPRGAPIIIAADFSPEAMFAFVGALIGGFVPAFLAPFTERQHFDQFAKTISGVIEYTRPGAIVASAGFTRDLVPRQVPLILTDQAGGAATEPDVEWVSPGLDDVAFLQFSSGTTGLRKGVMLHHRAVVGQIRAFLKAVPLGEGDLIASWLPLYHDMGLIACFIIPMAAGIPVALQDPIEWARQPARLLAAIERHRASHVWLPNFAFNHLRLTVPSSTHFDLSSVKAFINCSEPCKPATFDAFAERFARDGVREEMLGTSYAMAEAVFAVTQSPVGARCVRLTVDREALQARGKLVACPAGADGRVLLSTGTPLPGIQIAVLSDDLMPVADGTIGQIALAGDYIFQGYHNNPAAMTASFRDGSFLTGDLGAVLDGELFITGRLKDVIIVSGRNFYAHDIEECVSRVAGVKPGRAGAFPIDNEIAGSEEVAIVAETAWGPERYPEISRMIKRAVRETLGLSAVRPYPVPIGWLVKTTSGKMSRNENRDKYFRECAAGLIAGSANA